MHGRRHCPKHRHVHVSTCYQLCLDQPGHISDEGSLQDRRSCLCAHAQLLHRYFCNGQLFVNIKSSPRSSKPGCQSQSLGAACAAGFTDVLDQVDIAADTQQQTHQAVKYYYTQSCYLKPLRSPSYHESPL